MRADPKTHSMPFKGPSIKGVRYMETDVHLTLDGHLVAFHDRSLLRMTGAPRLIRDLTLADVVATPLTHGARIPTLLELLEAFPNAKFNIDLKSDETVEPFIKLAKANPYSRSGLRGFFLTLGPTQQNLPCPAFALVRTQSHAPSGSECLYRHTIQNIRSVCPNSSSVWTYQSGNKKG